MKKLCYTLLAAAALTFSACNDDDFTESIFDTTTPVVDTTLVTAPFDQWLYENFVVPYNTEIIYKFSLPSSDFNYQLTPAEYKRSQLLAHLVRHLFYDVYTSRAGEDFMKLYGPRIFHFIGSAGYNANAGTEIMGTASGGIKITLYNVNGLKYGSTWTPADISHINEYYFHTMHHEFSHILHQTKSYPVSYGQVTPSTYEPFAWQDRDSVSTHGMGYVTNYGSSATYEDFVEMLSCIITDSDETWMRRLINATLGGVRTGDKEVIKTFIDSLQIRDIDNSNATWNKIQLWKEEGKDGGFKRYVTSLHFSDPNYPGEDYENLTVNNDLRYLKVAGDAGDTVSVFRREKDVLTWDKYLNDWVQITSSDTLAGFNAMKKKIDIATEWYTEKWNLYVYDIREDVRQRQNNINDYIKENVTIYDYNE